MIMADNQPVIDAYRVPEAALGTSLSPSTLDQFSLLGWKTLMLVQWGVLLKSGELDPHKPDTGTCIKSAR